MVIYEYISFPDDIGGMVRDARTELGLSQVELAEKSGCSQRLISEFERGKDTIGLGKALAVFHALGLNVGIAPARTPEQSRELVTYGVERIARQHAEKPRTEKHLADYLDAEYEAEPERLESEEADHG